MVSMSEEQVRKALEDAVVLLAHAPGFGVPEVVDRACDALVAGIDSPHLRELAGASRDESRWVLDPLVESTAAELGLTTAAEPAEEERRAVRGMARLLVRGVVSPRDFVAWAYGSFLFDGTDQVQGLVQLEYLYDEAEWGDPDPPARVDRAALVLAQGFLDGSPVALEDVLPDRVSAVAPVRVRLRAVPWWRRALWCWRR